jgi:hypothetical protein
MPHPKPLPCVNINDEVVRSSAKAGRKATRPAGDVIGAVETAIAGRRGPSRLRVGSCRQD